jgi:hypothetical protein
VIVRLPACARAYFRMHVWFDCEWAATVARVDLTHGALVIRTWRLGVDNGTIPRVPGVANSGHQVRQGPDSKSATVV